MSDGYRFIERDGPGPLVFAFHGTGGDERQLFSLAGDLAPDAWVIAPRGDVSEAGAARFFARKTEGVYDMDDLARAVEKLAGFVEARRVAAGERQSIAIGYSNGANIIAATAMAHPQSFETMVLMHPLIPWAPEPSPGLAGRRFLITAGRRDPICPAPETERLAAYLEAQGADVTLTWHDGGHEVREDEIAAARAFLE